MTRTPDHQALAGLPSVDELLKNGTISEKAAGVPRVVVVQAIREVLAGRRTAILSGALADLDQARLIADICRKIESLSAYSLRPVINATGIVLHTNLGRAALSAQAIRNMISVGAGYSNLEYDLETGKRGKRHVHVRRILRQITGAEDAIIVNNNAAAVLLSLNTLSQGKEAVVSRGELVEIGGSFRVPDVMAASGAVLREVGTTNKTHLHDYQNAINENTGLLLKVHQSNYKMTGFTEEVGIDELVSLGRRHKIPVIYDLGSGCLVDIRPFGIHTEPTVQEIVKSGVDLVTFSGDKLLGGPQGGIIAGKKTVLERVQKNPLARALRVDKLTIAAFEATLAAFLDPERALREIPTLSMLFAPAEEIRKRARKIAAAIRRRTNGAAAEVVKDVSKAGGGSLPDAEFGTYTVVIRPARMKVNELERRLRSGRTPVIGRIKKDVLILDARTVSDSEVALLADMVAAGLSQETAG